MASIRNWEYQMSLRGNLAEENFNVERPFQSINNGIWPRERGFLTSIKGGNRTVRSSVVELWYVCKFL